jgi:hypothetical protein
MEFGSLFDKPGWEFYTSSKKGVIKYFYYNQLLTELWKGCILYMTNYGIWNFNKFHKLKMHTCRDRMVVGFTTTCAISAYHH